MDLTKHCQLCEHQRYDVLTGTRCGLTNEVPVFTGKCPDILFETRYEEKIKEINIEYELVKRTKGISLGNFFVFITISLSIIIGGYLLGTYSFDKGVISTVPLVIMGVGVLILPLATGPLNKFRWGMKIARQKKKELDELLKSYNVQYSIDVIVTKDLHGNQDISTNLTFQRKHYR